MEYLPLLGIAVVIVGFALKWDSLGIVVVAAVATALCAAMTPIALFETIGKAFVANRNMANFLIIFPVVGMLEKNGLKETAAKLMLKIKRATPANVIMSYGVLRSALATFAVGLGGFAGFVRPVVFPMASGALTKDGNPLDEEAAEDIKGMASAIENVGQFFGQAVFLGGGAFLLVKATLEGAGYEVDPVKMMASHYPLLIISLVVSGVFFTLKSRQITRRHKAQGQSKGDQ